MKAATFKTYYKTDTEFDGNDFGQMLNSDYVTPVDGTQLDAMHASGGGKSLVDIFDQDDYVIEYLGKDLGEHRFNVTNGNITVELQMANELFVANFRVE